MIYQFEISEDLEKAFTYMVNKMNTETGLKFTKQDILNQQVVYYFKRMLKPYLPLAITDEKLVGLSDTQQAELIAKTINTFDSFVDSIELDAVEKPTVMRKFLDWIKLK